jgi:heme/copper-type cytochrome/quinol oxidase subunit 2
MKPISIVMMILVQGPIIFFTFYFLWRALTAPKREEPDSLSENDND